jgi:hypothetical protein
MKPASTKSWPWVHRSAGGHPKTNAKTFAEEVLNACTRRSLQNDGAEGAPGY